MIGVPIIKPDTLPVPPLRLASPITRHCGDHIQLRPDSHGGVGKFRWLNPLFRKRVADQVGQFFVDRDDLVGRAGQGPEQQQVGLVARQEHPFTIATLDDGAGSHW